MKQCEAQFLAWRQWKQCESPVWGGGDRFCYGHDPEMAGQRQQLMHRTTKDRDDLDRCVLELRELGLTYREIGALRGCCAARAREMVLHAQIREREAKMR